MRPICMRHGAAVKSFFPPRDKSLFHTTPGRACQWPACASNDTARDKDPALGMHAVKAVIDASSHPVRRGLGGHDRPEHVARAALQLGKEGIERRAAPV